MLVLLIVAGAGPIHVACWLLLLLLGFYFSGAGLSDLALLRMRFVVWSQSPAVDVYFDWCSVTLRWPTGVSEPKSPEGAEFAAIYE